jgi:hypothetical protein
MRVTALVFSIIGAIASIILGIWWAFIGNVAGALAQGGGGADAATTSLINATTRAGYSLFASFILAIVGGVMAMTGKGKIGAGLLLVGAALPAVFYVNALIATWLLVLAGLFAFLAKPKTAPTMAPAQPQLQGY